MNDFLFSRKRCASNRICLKEGSTRAKVRIGFASLLFSVFAIVALTCAWDLYAWGQETATDQPPAPASSTSRPQLERVEVPRPERRPTPRATSPTQGGDLDETGPTDQSSSEIPGTSRASGDPGTSPLTATGTPGPATSLPVLTGKSAVSLGAPALPGQVQVMTPQDIQELNVRGDNTNLFRKIAGVKPVNYGQGQMGTAFMIRGFRSGGEIGVFIDGVPQNFPSATTTGKFEISWLAPEVIEKIEIIKGPMSALYGDFALGGVVNITTKKSEPSPSVNSYGGSFGNFRAFGILSNEGWVPTPFLAHEWFTIDGYRDNSQLQQWSPFNKVSVPLFGGVLSLRYNYFQSDYGAPGYWPIDWVKSGKVHRKRAYNTSDGGYQKRYELAANYGPRCGERGLYATLYKADYHGNRYYTFLPSVANVTPSSPASQAARQDDRRYWGGRLYYNLVFGDMGSLTLGGETRQDSGEAQQYSTVRRQRTTTTYDYDMRLSNWALFMQGQIKPHEKVKIVGGVRWDYFVLDINNLTRPANSGTGFPFIRSPKIGFVFTPTENLNIYGNIGSGFRSPANSEMSPRQAVPKRFGLEPAMVQTYDVGLNTSLFGNLYLAADYYQTNMQREIRTDSAGNPVVVGDTVRKGYELEARLIPSENINFFANYAWVDAKVIDPIVPGQNLVIEISEHSIKGGVTMQRCFGPYGKVSADLYYEYTSGAPYYRSTSDVPVPTAAQLATPIFGPDFDTYNFKLTYTGNGWSSFFSAQCKPREYSSDYTWVNNSILVYDPPPKWALTAGLTYNFW